MPDKVEVPDYDSSFFIDHVSGMLTNRYFLSKLYHPSFSDDSSNIESFLLDSNSMWLELINCQRSSLSINWPQSCFYDVIQKQHPLT